MKKLILISTAAMMMTSFCASAKKEKQTKIVNPADMEIRREIAATPEKSGGIYYAYPYSTDSLAPVPAGFEPVYISHYGRHGSRWHTSAKLHDNTLKVLQKQYAAGNLTAEGEEVMKLVEICRDHTKGHIGELSALGERQHKAIATRMCERFPSLFKDGDVIVARSSTEPRCIISMAAFSEALKEYNPRLELQRHATPGDMNFIAFHTQEALDIYKKPQEWKIPYDKACDSLYQCKATASRLFRDPSKIKKLPQVMKDLHHMAIAVQNVDGLDVNLLTHFNHEDLYNLWKGEAYRQYVRHGNSVDGKRNGPQSSKNLMKDILDCADESLAGKRTAVDLRFGHDVFLLRQLALMGIEGSDDEARGIDEASRVWQEYRLTPMAANLQITIFRNAKGEEIATVLLNERPAKIHGVKEYAPGYYRWSDLNAKWRKTLE